jgi:hypothetical protein
MVHVSVAGNAAIGLRSPPGSLNQFQLMLFIVFVHLKIYP